MDLTQQQQQGVQATINRDKSIVVKTLPDNVLEQFNDANTDRLSRMGVNDAQADPFNPFDEPQPVVAQTVVHQGLDSSVQANQVQQAAVNAQATDFDDPFSPPETRAQAPPPPQQVAPVQTQPEIDPEARQLIGVIRGVLRKEYEAGKRDALTIGVVSARIKTITGKSWGGHWQNDHGPLTSFVKKHPTEFVLLRNKYLVLNGTEHEMVLPSDKVETPTPAPVQSKPAQSLNQQKSLNAMQTNPVPQQQQQQFGFPQQQQQQFGFPQQQHNPFGQNQMMMQQQNPQMMYQQQQTPMYQQNMGMPQQQQFGMQNQQPMFQQNIPQQLQQQVQQPIINTTTPSTNFDPFAPAQPQPQVAQAIPVASTSADDWWNPSTSQPPAATATDPSNVEWDDPLEAFEDKSESQKEKEKQELVRLEQEKKDQKYAQELQDEEYARSVSARGDSARTGQPTYVTLSASQIREIAEGEIGRENIKILQRFSVKKYGREGRPHQRTLWVTSGITHLVWESAQFDGSQRGIELQKVTEILVGRMTHTIERWTKDRRKVSQLCFSLVTNSRTLDLQACSVIQRDSLVAALKKVVEFSKKHKPIRIDRNFTKLLVDAA